MKLIIGSRYLESELQDVIQLVDDGEPIQSFPLSSIFSNNLGNIVPHSSQIEELEIGFVDLESLDFLGFFPNVVKVWIMSPKIKNVEGLRHLTALKSLKIDRPTCRLDVLGELTGLEEIYLDDWRPGIQSLFNLKNLVKVGLQKFGYPSLEVMSHWSQLRELWLNAGILENLDGIPVSVRELKLTDLRKLRSISALERCLQLEKFVLEGSKKVESLNGIGACVQLRFLSISKVGLVDTLRPLEDLKRIEHMFLADGIRVQDPDVSALYSLPSLRKLIVSKEFGVQKDKVSETAPECEVILVR